MTRSGQLRNHLFLSVVLLCVAIVPRFEEATAGLEGHSGEPPVSWAGKRISVIERVLKFR